MRKSLPHSTSMTFFFALAGDREQPGARQPLRNDRRLALFVENRTPNVRMTRAHSTSIPLVHHQYKSLRLKLEPLGVGFNDDRSEYISAFDRLDGQDVMDTPGYGPWDRREHISERELVDFPTVQWSFPYSPTSASVCSGSLPSSEVMSVSTWKENMDPVVSGNCSTFKSLAPLYSNKKSNNAYKIIHWRTTIWTIRLPDSG